MALEAASCNGDLSASRTGGMVARFLNWLCHAVTDLSEKAVDDALDSDSSSTVDFEILGDPRHPRFHEMQRRYQEQQAREDRDDLG